MSYPVVTVDDSEPPQLVDELAELGYEVEVEHLTIGDFEGKTTVGEIKRGEDFFSSVVDKRLFNQTKRMRSLLRQTSNSLNFLTMSAFLCYYNVRLKI